jgi:hypothetical protein
VAALISMVGSDAGSGRSRQVVELDDLADLDLNLLEQIGIPLGVLDGPRTILEVDQCRVGLARPQPNPANGG